MTEAAGHEREASNIMRSIERAKAVISPEDSEIRAPCRARHPQGLGPERERDREHPFVIGIVRGEGIGPEVVDAGLAVLDALSSTGTVTFERRCAHPTREGGNGEHGSAIDGTFRRFCEDVFTDHGVLFAGAVGGRFVYDMRIAFDLYHKINPIATNASLRDVGCLKPDRVDGVDLVVVRECVGGIYQGRWHTDRADDTQRVAAQSFSYDESQVRRVVRIAAEMARDRRRRLLLVTKPNGIPDISRLWLDCARDAAQEHDVELTTLEIDYAVYRLIDAAPDLDVVVTSNLFGDILVDLGGLLLGSRGLCYGASYSADGAAVYQTNHGAAHDLAGTDLANPGGQILSLAMMLRVSFGLHDEADLVDSAIDDVWRAGFRTPDIMQEGCVAVGTREMTDRICSRIVELAATTASPC
ncbi:MAG: 3-isopropylmalate dehydrogenase [Phycisphaeraceae bacterium]|nr:3-isopropylmalate dehydrogenase [Phycisphaeraceae bacterium]